MASYTIKIEGGSSFPCADDVYILDAAEEAGVDLPYSLPSRGLLHLCRQNHQRFC